MGAYEHQELPFERLVEELQPQRSRSYTPLFQVVFAIQNVPTWTVTESDAPPPEASEGEAQIGTGTSKFDLTVTMGEVGRVLMGAFEYDTDLFGAQTIERMVGHFQTLLTDIVADPNQRLSSFRLLSEDETQGYTPSDFPDAELNRKDFEGLLEEFSQLSWLE